MEKGIKREFFKLLNERFTGCNLDIKSGDVNDLLRFDKKCFKEIES